MPKKKFGIEFEGFEELSQELRDLEQDIKPIAEQALIATHEYITPLIHEKMKANYMPAKGHYMGARATAKEDKQILDEPNITWNGDQGAVDIGFSLDNGITPLYLIYGTAGPTPTKPVKGLKAAIYGKKTKDEIAQIQENIFYEALKKAMVNNGK